MNQKNPAWASAEMLARISLETTKPPVLAKLMSHTVSRTFCRCGGSHEAIVRRSRGPSAAR